MATWTVLADELATTGVHAAILPSGEVLYSPTTLRKRTLSSVHIGSCGTKFAARQGTSRTSRPESLLCRSLLARRRTAPCGRRAIEQLGDLSELGRRPRYAERLMCVNRVGPDIRTCLGAGITLPVLTLADGRGFIFGGLWKRVPTELREPRVRDIRLAHQQTIHRRAHLTQAFMEHLYPFGPTYCGRLKRRYLVGSLGNESSVYLI